MKKLLVLASSLVLVVLDQATKLAAEYYLADLPQDQARRVIKGILYLKPTENSGGMWGVLASLPAGVFVGLSVVFGVYLVWLMLRLDRREHGYLPPLALLLGGFVGNGIDRFRNGYVTDFIYFTGYPPWLISTFNVADVALLGGVGMYLVAGWTEPEAEPEVLPVEPR